MNNLTVINKDGILVVDSLRIAKDFDKQHKHILDSIDILIKHVGVAEKSADLFIKSEYTHEQNKQVYPMYYLTRDGFSLLVMGFNGEKALKWKLKYIEAFNAMEQQLSQQKSDSYMINNPIERAQRWIEEQKEKQKVIDERDEAIQTKALIGSKREATCMNKVSQLSKENAKLKEEIGFSRNYATIKKTETMTKRKFPWKKLKEYSNAHEIEIKRVPDVNYGSVNAYSAEAWLAVYDVDLEAFFN